jgi:hypothetical protein
VRSRRRPVPSEDCGRCWRSEEDLPRPLQWVEQQVRTAARFSSCIF